MSRRSLRAALISGVAIVAAVLVVPSSGAASGEPPVTGDDTVTLDAGDDKVVDVLANDSDPDDDTGADLAVCRVQVPDGSPLAYSIVTGGLDISSPITASGTFTLTYYACDYDYLTPATLTVTIKKVPVVTARKDGKPGHVQFKNPGDQAVTVTYTVPSGDGPQGKVVVPSMGTKTVTVTKPKIVFVAVRKSGAIVGYGTVKDIKLKKTSRH